jgi:hypothetical protein
MNQWLRHHAKSKGRCKVSPPPRAKKKLDFSRNSQTPRRNKRNATTATFCRLRIHKISDRSPTQSRQNPQLPALSDLDLSGKPPEPHRLANAAVSRERQPRAGRRAVGLPSIALRRGASRNIPLHLSRYRATGGKSLAPAHGNCVHTGPLDLPRWDPLARRGFPSGAAFDRRPPPAPTL